LTVSPTASIQIEGAANTSLPTLVITDDSPEPALILFMVEGGLIYLEKSVNGGFAAYEDGFTLLELTRKYYREAGLDVRQLDLLVR
jgi:hypothetical protein